MAVVATQNGAGDARGAPSMAGAAAERIGRRARALLFLLALAGAPPALADPDLPNPSSNLETIPAGSLIIAMDGKQTADGSAFNLRAYGLANELLWNEIPVKWVIRNNKGTQGGSDMTSVPVQREYPSVIAPQTLTFRGGPFVIHRDFAAEARPVIANFGGSVVVYRTTADVNADVRHTILQRRKVAVFDDGGNAAIHTAILNAAGFDPALHFEVIPAATLLEVNATSCFTSASEPHWDDEAGAVDEADAVAEFVESGGNFLAQCIAAVTYENNANFLTSNGVLRNNVNGPFDYLQPNLPFSQFQGTLDNEGGSLQEFSLAGGSTFNTRSHGHIRPQGDTTRFRAAATKVNAFGDGSLVYYLGGHNFDGASQASINGRRMYLNFVMTPSVRPTGCDLTFPELPGTWTMTADTTLATDTNVPVDHPFTVTNDFNQGDRVNFGLADTAASFTTELRFAGGAALTDTDSDGNPDTGLLAAGGSVNLVLRVTPQSGAGPTDVTTITGTSVLADTQGGEPVTIDVVKTTTHNIPDLTGSSKVVVDGNGGDVEPGELLQFTITLTESGGFPAANVRVLDVLEENLSTLTVLDIPVGATDASDLANATLDVQGISIPANGSVEIVFTAVAVGNAGDVIDNTADITGNDISLSVSSTPLTIQASTLTTDGEKPLYLSIGAGAPGSPIALQRALPTPTDPANTYAEILKDNQDATWDLSPALVSELVTTGGPITASLYLTRKVKDKDKGKDTTGSFRVDVERATGGAIATATRIDETLSNDDAAPTLVTMSLPVGVETITPAQNLRLRVTNVGTGKDEVDIHVLERSQLAIDNGDPLLEQYSRVLIPLSTVINIDALGAFDDTFANGGGGAVGVVSPGEEIYLRAIVSDPFGTFDINRAEITVLDANGGATTLTATDMGTAVADDGVTKTFEVSFTPNEVQPPIGPAGFWDLSIEAVEGLDAEGISHTRTSDFELGVPQLTMMKFSPEVVSDPVNTTNFKRIPGAVVRYEIQVTNQGRGRPDDGSLTITDSLPAGLLLAEPVSEDPLDAITVAEGTPASGIDFDAARDLTFLLAPATGTVPTDADDDGCYDNVVGFTLEPEGRMNGEAPPAPRFTIEYRACIE